MWAFSAILVLLLGVVEGSNQQPHLLDIFLTDLYQLTMAGVYLDENISGKLADNGEPPIAVFDLYFRDAPFNGDFAVFAGLNEVLGFLENLTIREDSLQYLMNDIQVKKNFEGRDLSKVIAYLAGMGKFDMASTSYTDPKLLELLKDKKEFVDQGKTDFEKLEIYAVKEGTVVFPNTPLLRVEGPIVVAQILETTLLNVVNFATLVASNALRYRIAGDGLGILHYKIGARDTVNNWVTNYKSPNSKTTVASGTNTINSIVKDDAKNARLKWEELVWNEISEYTEGNCLLEDTNYRRKRILDFGLRRAQGPDGGVTASQYCRLGLLDATSNVLAAEKYGIPVAGTHAHAFVCVHDSSWADLEKRHPGVPFSHLESFTPSVKITTLDFTTKCKMYETEIFNYFAASWEYKVNLKKSNEQSSELVAFTAYALSYPENLTALILIDTYNMYNGLANFLAVALTLIKLRLYQGHSKKKSPLTGYAITLFF